MLVNPVLRRQRQEESWGFLANQPNQQAPGPIKRLSLKKLSWKAPKKQHYGWRLTSTCIHTCLYMYMHAQTCIHSLTYRHFQRTQKFRNLPVFIAINVGTMFCMQKAHCKPLLEIIIHETIITRAALISFIFLPHPCQ